MMLSLLEMTVRMLHDNCFTTNTAFWNAIIDE